MENKTSVFFRVLFTALMATMLSFATACGGGGSTSTGAEGESEAEGEAEGDESEAEGQESEAEVEGEDMWRPTSTVGAPSAHFGHTAIWTGSEMIVWGGSIPAEGINNYQRVNTGGRYNPVTDTWIMTTTTNTPSARWGHTAIWTGSEMVVWGGETGVVATVPGGRYNPVTDAWSLTSITDAPRYMGTHHTAVWNGSEMLIWAFGEGARYNPMEDYWRAIPVLPDDNRNLHSAIWTGSEMIVWGGFGMYGGIEAAYLTSGFGYDPFMDVWSSINGVGAPSPRMDHAAVWTGSEMIVWGGVLGDADGKLYGFVDGGRYLPTDSRWISMAVSPAIGWEGYSNPQSTALWTGSEMFLWGIWDGDCCAGSNPGNGYRYNPISDTWQQMSTEGAPDERYGHTAIWTGTEMIVWGGDPDYIGATGGRYSPKNDQVP